MKAALLAAALACLAAVPPARAAAADTAARPTLEHEVKAAFVLQLLGFVEWSPETAPRDSILVHVVGSGPMGRALRALRGERIGRFVVAVRDADDPTTREPCQALFIDCVDADEAVQELRLRHAGGVLTIGDCAGFAARGGMVNLVVTAGRVGLEVNPDTAARGGVKISSKVLRLARIVREGD